MTTCRWLWLFLAWGMCAGCGMGGPRAAMASAAAPSAAASAQATPAPAAIAQTPQDAVVVEGRVAVEVDEVARAAAALRADVVARGGRVVAERFSGAGASWRGSMTLRLPPEQVAPLTDWLEARGDTVEVDIRRTDVSKTLFDQEIALENLRLTLERLRALLAGQSASMAEVLAIEQELARVRGEIERIEGERRFLQDRVAEATLEVELRRRPAAALASPRAVIYPGPRLSALLLLDPDGRERLRLGGGAAVHLGVPRLSLELDVFRGPGDEDPAVVASFGGATYSDFLGRGERRFLNPYLGLRAGYGYLGRHAFVVAGGGGVELFKSRRLLVDVNVRALAFVGSDVEAALVGAASLVFAF